MTGYEITEKVHLTDSQSHVTELANGYDSKAWVSLSSVKGYNAMRKWYNLANCSCSEGDAEEKVRE